jgi:membrane protease subunit (stomatin/prohibitin family)
MAIFEVIKYQGDNDIFVWKHPAEDFNTLSQLIVNESQEALFFKNGEALDLFGPGRHTLHTQNIPLIRKLVNLPMGGESPFHCQVFFINKTMPLDVKWGTPSQIQVLDPKYQIVIHAGANGGLGVQIEDSRKFITKLVGTKSVFDRDSLVNYFKELIATRTKTYLTRIMSEVPFILVNSRLDDISAALKEKLAEDMREFGVKLVNFFVSTIQLRENEHFEKIQSALAQAASRNIEGYNWVDEQISEITKRYASNEGAQNSPGGMMAQMPLAFAFGNMLRNTAQPLMEQSFSGTPQAFAGFGAPPPKSPFDSPPAPIKPKAMPASAPAASTDISDFEQRLKKLEMLKGKIPDEQYEAKMQEILNSI